MTDVLTPEQRKKNMSRIKGKNTTPEIKLRKILFSHGIRGYRVHYPLPGKPDIVFIRKRIAIFVDGCFWHKCPQCYREPDIRKEFWVSKIQGNVERDNKINEILMNQGWTVIRFWEHDIRKNPNQVLEKLFRYYLYDYVFRNLFSKIAAIPLAIKGGTAFPI
jgi:DNA mismatch endonuclease Vsr